MSKISIIIPAYNAEQTIDRCLNSILNGTYKEIELIVVNDGSEDSTEHRVSLIAEKDSRVKLINQKNTGVAGARNTGLRNVTGQYIAWCDADDWAEPDWLESLHKHIVEYDADIAICRCQIDGRASVNTGEVEIWDRDTAIRKFLEHKQLNGTLWNKLFHSELFLGEMFDPTLSHWEDTELVWRLLHKTDRIVRFHLEKYHYTVSNTSLMSSPCTKERVYSTLTVWERIEKHCATLCEEYWTSAKTMLGLQSFGVLLAMFRSDYRDVDAEKIIRGYMRSNFCTSMKAIGDPFRYMFYGLVVIHLGLARWVYKTMINR